MQIKNSWLAYKIPVLILIGVMFIILISILTYRYLKFKHKQPYKIGIILNSVEITPEDLKVVQYIIAKKLESLNEQGGIDGHQIESLYIDDKGDNKLLYKLVFQTIKDPNLIAYIGCNRSSQINAIKELIGRSKIPFIGGFNITGLVQKYPNIFTSEVSIKEVSVAFKHLLKSKATKAAFIYKRGDLYSETLLKVGQELEAEDPDFQIIMKKSFPLGYEFHKNEIRELAEHLNKQADFLIISFELETANELIDGLWKSGLNIPVFSGLTDMSQIHSRQFQANEVYDINAFAIPDAMNMKLEEQIATIGKQFNTLTAFDFRVGFAIRHADEIGLIKEASQDKTLPINSNIREKINAGLSKYIDGYKIYSGEFADWYFTPERSLAGDALLSWKPRNFTLPVLAPVQFFSTDTSETPFSVLYADMSMVEISQVNEQNSTFFATFYLNMYCAGNLTLDQLDFANADRNRINHEPLIEARLIRSSKDSLPQQFYNYLYKISGKFIFEPDLRRYPYDRQKFPIIIQAKNALQPLLVQPPEIDIRDSIFESAGWIYRNNYVGYTHDLINTNDDFYSIQRNIPYYKFSFVYELSRARIDFTLKTLIPLLAILVITYFSVYIPHKEFEALAGIQVTGLLAAIALYFSTYKPELQNATISDSIFIFTYVMITSLIGTSVMLYLRYHDRNIFTWLAKIYQRVLFPVIVLVFVLFLKY
jgi:hypothetical protein